MRISFHSDAYAAFDETRKFEFHVYFIDQHQNHHVVMEYIMK
jgi:hypothetical protein